MNERWTLAPGDHGTTLAAALRARLPDRSWSEIRRLVTSGKVRLGTAVAADPATRVVTGDAVSLDMAARKADGNVRTDFRLVFEDAHLVVVDKPEGVSSVPFERKETGTAMDLVRAVWRAQGRRATATPLYIVHRIDKDTSGLLCFAKTRLAERALHRVFQQHTALRSYIAVAQGRVEGGRLASRIIPDRGDGLRGSTVHVGHGQHAVTHVAVVERLQQATVCRVTLETGRTHQIRIHLAESGHPLVGETVYIRDLLRRGVTPLACPRLLLQAATLGLPHPVTGVPLAFTADPPPDFQSALARLRRQR